MSEQEPVSKSQRKRDALALHKLGRELVALPDAQANFIYLPTGERTYYVYFELERRGVVTRPFPGDGIRVTVGTPEENDRFLASLTEVDQH